MLKTWPTQIKSSQLKSWEIEVRVKSETYRFPKELKDLRRYLNVEVWSAFGETSCMCWLASRYDDKTWPKQNSDLYRAHPLRMSELWLSIMHYDYHNQIASSFLIGFDPEFESWDWVLLPPPCYLFTVLCQNDFPIAKRRAPPLMCCTDAAFSFTTFSMNEAYRSLRWSLWPDVMAVLPLNLPSSQWVWMRVSDSVCREACTARKCSVVSEMLTGRRISVKCQDSPMTLA